MDIQTYLQAFLLFLSGVLIIGLIVTPTVIGFMLLKRISNKSNNQSNSITRLEQLEENDSIIVEDVNTALEQVVGRLNEIEEVLGKEQNKVKGFRK